MLTQTQMQTSSVNTPLHSPYSDANTKNGSTRIVCIYVYVCVTIKHVEDER